MEEVESRRRKERRMERAELRGTTVREKDEEESRS